MEVTTRYVQINTQPNGHMHDITSLIEEELEKIKIKNGIVTIFCIGSTGAISTVEYEPGLLKDIPAALHRIAPENIEYKHHETWHDDNGKSHVQATILGPSLTVIISSKKLILGQWQQIVFIECDTRERKRKIALQFLGN